MTEPAYDFVRLFILLLIISYAFWILFVKVLEPLYIRIFGKPLYLYFYLSLQKLPIEQHEFLAKNFLFYKALSPYHKRIFEHRIVSFMKRYPFFGKGKLQITPEIRITIAVSFVKLTFGMRYYLTNVFNKIIIYPDTYESTINKLHYNGEFNPKLKTVVFSWKHFELGNLRASDNINLGIHEFTHVVHCHAMNYQDASATIFTKQYFRIMKEVKHPPNVQRLIDSDYFRFYAYTNEYEFLAVIVEHFFETPDLFEKEFPQLFLNVKKMINFRS